MPLGNPVDALTGRKHEEVVDWRSDGVHPFELTRSYSSTSLVLSAPAASRLGRGWRSNFDAAASWNFTPLESASLVHIVLPNSFEYSFMRLPDRWQPVLPSNGGGVVVWNTHRSDLDVRLSVDATGLVMRVQDGTVYQFNTSGQLVQIRYPGGYRQTLTYRNGLNTRVADNLGRWVEFTYANARQPNLLTEARTSDGKRISYAFQHRYLSLDPQYESVFSMEGIWALKTVTYPDATKRSYEYLDDPGNPFLLTGITDERGVRYARFTYDAEGRATSSEHAGGVDRWQFAHGTDRVTVTNPLGRQTVYHFIRSVGGLRQLTSVDGIATGNCAASNTRYAYDANGFRSQAIDAEGRVTTWTRDSRGYPLTTVEGAGTPAARTTTMSWDPVRPLTTRIQQPGLTIDFAYDEDSRITRRTETDAGGQIRTTAYVYSQVALPGGAFKLLTAIDGPLPGASDILRYGYDASGNLTSVTNEVGHVTRITSLDGGGRPLSITDPNGVLTTMTYDARGRLASVTVNPGAQQARTVIAYDPAGQVTRVTSPDGTFLQYAWSEARRLTAVSNNAGERIDYTHNLNGDVTSRTVKSGSGAIIRQQSAVFDELGRIMRAIGAAGQQTLFRYDRTDKLTQVQDPRGGIFAYAYDGLQRIASLTNEAGARVTLTRDAQDEVTAYRDPRGLTTAYLRNGFGEVIRESGPDVGTTVIVRDARGLATRITDPRGIVTNLTYDAAGRLVSETYPADATQNVTYYYDSTANGNRGVGRLTAITDGSGSLARRYDALGRVVAETRAIGARSYSTFYAYNAAGRLTAITYPSGRVVNYARSSLGRASAINMQSSASAPAQSVAGALTWSPMSTRLAGLTHGNGLTLARSYDRDGRLATLKLANGASRVMDLGYAYGDGMNLTAVNDNVSAANSVSLTYDAAQRLASARGPWGTLSYGYLATGDRSQESLTAPAGGSPLTTLLSYPANSNRLSTTSVGSFTTRAFTYDAAGNLVTQVMGPLRLAFAYNQRNRPVTVTRTGDGTQVSNYLYNALEQMVQRRTNAPRGPAGTVHYVYGLDGSLLAEADGSTGAITREYIWLPVDDASSAADNDNEEGTQTPPLPVALVTGVNTPAPALLMVHADHLGRPVRLTDMTRATVWSAAYDPFGQPWQITGTVEQNLRFPGQYFLLETGLSYNWHRVYDPATGRYTQPDPLRFVDGPSVYGYATASPMMRVDPEGLNPLIARGIIAFCERYPHHCAATGIWVWESCRWVFRKGFSGGGGGGGDDDEDECEQQLSDDEADCSRSTKDSAMPGARSACHQRATIRFRICRENQRGASKKMPPRWTAGKDDEVWRNYGR